MSTLLIEESETRMVLENINTVLAKEELDFEIDPPPDLVIEVELTRSAIDKMELFAAMRVREVWRHDGTSVEFYRFSNGRYDHVLESLELPGLDSALVKSFIDQRLSSGETTWIRAFRREIQ